MILIDDAKQLRFDQQRETMFRQTRPARDQQCVHNVGCGVGIGGSGGNVGSGGPRVSQSDVVVVVVVVSDDKLWS